MPIFEYKCNKCGHKMEFLEKATTSKKHICEKCGSTDTQKLFSGFSVGQSGGNDNSCPTCPGGTCGLNY